MTPRKRGIIAHIEVPSMYKKASKPAPPLENDIRNLILEWLNLQSGVTCWRQNTGFHVFEHKGKKRAVRYGQPGQSDISGIMLPSGRRIEIEVKRPGNKPTEDQKAWMAMIREHGGIAFWCDSLDRCMELFARYKDIVNYEDLPF